MSVSIMPLHPVFVGEVTGVDCRTPLAREEVAAIEAGMDEYAVLVFRDQDIADEEQIAFSRHLGELESYATPGHIRRRAEQRLGAGIADFSNLDKDGRIMSAEDRVWFFKLGDRLWHSDSSFRPVPAKYSILSGRVIPSWGANTEFADLRAAYDALPESTKRKIAGLVAEHSLLTSRSRLGFSDFDETERKAFEPVPQVLVRRLQDSGRLSLYLASHAGAIRGMARPEAEKLLKELIDHATQRQFVYTHRWRVNDLVMWDDRCTMHRGLEFDDQRYKRDMRRATVSDVAPTCEQMGLAVAAE